MINYGKTTSFAALALVGLALGGCPSATSLIEDKIKSESTNQSASDVSTNSSGTIDTSTTGTESTGTGSSGTSNSGIEIVLAVGEPTNAIGRSRVLKVTCAAGSTSDAVCEVRLNGNVSQYTKMKSSVDFKTADGTPITNGVFKVGDVAVFKTSGGDLAGFAATYTDVSKDENGNGKIDADEQDFEFVASNSDLTKSIVFERNRLGGDAFYRFIEVDDNSSFVKTAGATTDEYNGSYKNVNLIQGTLTPTDKITKSAKFKGVGEIDVRKLNTATGSEGESSYYGDSDISITQDGKVNGSVGNLVTRAGDDNNITIDGAVGSKIGLNNATLSGAEFSGGNVTWKNAAGADILSINPENSDFVGGFYGSDMNAAAGLFGAQVDKGNELYLLDGQFEAMKQ